MRRPLVLLVIGALLGASCADDGDDAIGDTLGPGATSESSTTMLEIPTTYLVFRTGPYSASVEAQPGISGQARFTVTDVGSGDTYADGQITDVEYLVVDLGMSLTLSAYSCGETEATGDLELSFDGPFPVDSLGDFEATGDGLTVTGQLPWGTSGTSRGSVRGTIEVDGVQCALDSIPLRISG